MTENTITYAYIFTVSSFPTKNELKKLKRNA